MRNKMNILKNLIIIIATYAGLFIINNIRNIINLLLNNTKVIIYISIPMIISLIIFLFYIYKIKKKNKYFNITFILLLAFYNICNGIFYSANLHTFFILYFVIMLFAFCIYLKLENYSYSLITGFSLMIIITVILGMLGLLKLVKYIIPIVCLIALFYVYKNKEKYSITNKLNSFFDKEHLIFAILFIIAIIGGVGRFVHIYDEYSHWAYDAKAVIYYDKLSTSQEIMSKTRSYAPIITCWHYIVAQFSEYQEQNLYIGLSIFCMIYIMSIFHNVYKKNNFLLIISVLISYSCAFFIGDVYNFKSLYADFAMGCVFGATLLNYYSTKKEIIKSNIPMYLLLIILTLIKPSGCVATFTVLLIMFLDYILKDKFSIKNIIKKIINFIKQYWKYIVIVVGAFLIWNIYIKIINIINVEFYEHNVRPVGLYADLKYKLNFNFILIFIKNVLLSLDQDLIYNVINLSFYKYVVLTFLIIYILRNIINKDNEKSNKKFVSLFIGYLAFFTLTVLSVFVMLSYYEASILASVGRYLGCMHTALIFLIVNSFISEKFINSNKRLIISISAISILLVGLSFNQVFYFITDYNERIETLNTKDRLTDKFKLVNAKTEEKSNVYIIDQTDSDGIMAMWYARYYLFPRKVNSSSIAISWKILTEKNGYDLQDWGMTAEDLETTLIKYKFDYLYLYTAHEEFYKITKNMYENYELAQSKQLFEVEIKNNKVTLIATE